ncbi:hypothetical protein ACOQFV_06545 [Nocardiopsis changdeensis]|uniref:DUF8175 domain-containing protein n=1 Tax=Nocardiopsis changdeensis TaxID=2831969 RepID=A0ABX8BMX0_9ACTN|nr:MULTISPECIES: hypothetical protein [Nocardiopsis]QUX23506.1 hypothetical protein KGD84_03780 [Nocardiopsis changdeensis]QYX39450.1 hypothetical protein K1J57_13235 [Nocardiopsis sp. MT53]
MSDENPFSRPSFIFSAGFLAALVVSGALVAVWPDDEDEAGADPGTASAPAGPGETPSPEEAPATPDGQDSVCGLEAHTVEFDMLLPLLDTTWTSIGGMRAPQTAEHGPGVVEDGGARYCYARTPEGAVLATGNFLALANAGGDRMDSQWERIVAPGPGRQVFIAEMESSQAPEGGVGGQIVAAKVVSYTEDEARISLALMAPDAVYASMTFDLMWVEGDWKIVVDESGESDPLFTVLEDLSGYTPWAAI